MGETENRKRIVGLALVGVFAIVIIAVILLAQRPAELPRPPEQPALSEEGSQARQGALVTGNQGVCAALENDAERRICEQAASDSTLYKNAIESRDKTLCAKITTNEIRDACESVLDQGITTVVKEI